MAWFTHQWLAYSTFTPFAAAAVLLPWTALHTASAGQLSRHVLGCSIFSSLLGWLLTLAGFGLSFIFALHGAFGVAVALLLSPQPSLPRVLAALGVLVAPIIVSSSVVCVFYNVMMQRMSLTGYLGSVAADAVIGALAGGLAPSGLDCILKIQIQSMRCLVCCFDNSDVCLFLQLRCFSRFTLSSKLMTCVIPSSRSLSPDFVCSASSHT